MIELFNEDTSWSTVMSDLTMIGLVLTGFGFGGSPSVTVPPAPYFTDVVITASPATTTIEAGDLALLTRETAVARHLVAALSGRQIPASTGYIYDLCAILDQLPKGQFQPNLIPGLGRALLAARTGFETRIDSLADWLAIARAVSPELVGKPVRVPERFLRRSPTPTGAALVGRLDLHVTTALRSTFGAHDADPASA